MATINAESKTGTSFKITSDCNGVYAEARGIRLGGMRIVRDGMIEACFPQKIGGKSMRVGAEFGDAEWENIKQMFEESERAASESVRSEIEYDKHASKIYATE